MSDVSGHQLVCIVGCPRSGTTWLQRLLAGHPRVRTGQESDVFDIYVGPQLRAWRRELDPTSSGRGGVGLGAYFDDAAFTSLLRRYALDLVASLLGAARSWGKGWAPRRARGAALMWVSHVSAVRESKVPPGQLVEV